MATRIATVVGALLVAVGASLAVSTTAEAKVLYGAIVYRWSGNGYQHGFFSDYPSSARLIMDIQNKWGSNAGYVVVRSGQCAALAYFRNAKHSQHERGFGTGKAESADAASNIALRDARNQIAFGGNTKLVRYDCQK